MRQHLLLIAPFGALHSRNCYGFLRPEKAVAFYSLVQIAVTSGPVIYLSLIALHSPPCRT